MLNLKNAALAMSAGLLLLAGCQGGMSMQCPVQKMQNPQADELNDSPLVVDGAMQIRDWQRVSVEYANGNTPAGPTGVRYEARWNQPEWTYAVIEPPLFVGQVIMMPVTYYQTPPSSEVMYTGATIDATYTAMPMLPGAAEDTLPTAAPVTEAAPTSQP